MSVFAQIGATKPIAALIKKWYKKYSILLYTHFLSQTLILPYSMFIKYICVRLVTLFLKQIWVRRSVDILSYRNLLM